MNGSVCARHRTRTASATGLSVRRFRSLVLTCIQIIQCSALSLSSRRRRLSGNPDSEPQGSYSVVPAKAGTQGFQSLAPCSCHGQGLGPRFPRGRRLENAANLGYSLEGRDPCSPWAPAGACPRAAFRADPWAGVTRFLIKIFNVGIGRPTEDRQVPVRRNCGAAWRQVASSAQLSASMNSAQRR